jgi:bifunctional DNase/RNase
MNCTRDNCMELATVHFLRAESFSVANEEHLCEMHAREYISRYHRSAYRRGPAEPSRGGIAEYYIELLAVHESSEEQGIYLRMAGGETRFFMLIGSVEAWTLSYNIRTKAVGRPLTHNAFFNTIRALGGTLTEVLVDRFDQAAKCYHAKLHIERSGQLIIVDVRPSDAFNLAVISRVPILIAAHLLQENAETSNG